MGTQKRERQKANRAKKQAEQEKAERTSAVKRNVVRWVLILAAAFAAVLLIAWIGGAFSGDDDDTPATTIPFDTLPAIIDTTLPGTAPGSTAPVTTTAGG